MFGLIQINYRMLKKMAYGLMFLSWILLIMGYFFKSPTNEASRWLFIGGRSWMTTSDFARVSLLIFTALTVLASYFDFGGIVWLAVGVGLLIAFFKGYLVAANFMHLNDNNSTINWTLILTVMFLIVLFNNSA